jgi:plastocyanin
MTTHTTRRATLIKAALITLVAFPAGVLAQSKTDVVSISQKNRTYAPEAVSLRAGQTLRIVNDDIFLHHAFVEDDKMEYDSGSMEEGETRDVRFDTPGSYQVKCAIHPKMRLDVTVE